MYSPRGGTGKTACRCWEMDWEEFQTGLRDSFDIIKYYFSVSSALGASMML